MNSVKAKPMSDVSKFLNRVEEATPSAITYGTPPVGFVIGGLTGSEWLMILSAIGVIGNIIVLSPKIHESYLYWKGVLFNRGEK